MPTNSSDPVHRIVFRVHGGKMRVSCYCRANPLKHARSANGDREYYEPMTDQPKTLTTFDIYNNPNNHFAPFKDEDRITT